MKRLTSLRQLNIGNIVLYVSYDNMNFASNDPDGWFATPCRVVKVGSESGSHTVVKIMPLNPKLCDDRPFTIVHDPAFAPIPAAPVDSHNDEPGFIHDMGMAGASTCRLFLLQLCGMEDDREELWGEVSESTEIGLVW